MKRKILIVEDEQKIAEVLADYLARSGFETHRLSDGLDVAPWVRKWIPDLVLLDVLLPYCDGYELCSRIRCFSDVPVIMITSRSDEADRLLGLGVGSDDYICKPFSASEVVARVQAVLRRSGGATAAPTASLVIDEELFQAVLDGHRLPLTSVEFKLLQVLAGRPGRVYSRSQLMDLVFLEERDSADRAIDSHIKNLRKKLQAVAPGRSFIHSIYGVGYKLELADGA